MTLAVDPEHDERRGPRLPVAKTERQSPQCLLGVDHEPAFRFELHRYGRRVSVMLCPACVRSLIESQQLLPTT